MITNHSCSHCRQKCRTLVSSHQDAEDNWTYCILRAVLLLSSFPFPFLFTDYPSAVWCEGVTLSRISNYVLSTIHSIYTGLNTASEIDNVTMLHLVTHSTDYWFFINIQNQSLVKWNICCCVERRWGWGRGVTTEWQSWFSISICKSAAARRAAARCHILTRGFVVARLRLGLRIAALRPAPHLKATSSLTMNSYQPQITGEHNQGNGVISAGSSV